MADTFKILVPIGFSEQSFLALDQALVFAKAIGDSEITVLSVIEDSSAFRKKIGEKRDSSYSDIKQKVSEKLKSITNEYGTPKGVSFKTMVAKGTVYEEIGRVTDLLDIQLVVMGTNGKPQNLRKRFIGSNAYRTATLVQPPVIAIKGVQKREKIETIIFPLVLDRRSKEKVGPAIDYARIFNAKIKVVSVNEGKDEAKMMRAHLHQVQKFIADNNVECSSELIEPTEGRSVVRNMLNYAYKNNGDLIIITEDSKTRDITDYFLGTDVQAMLYHSEIPVMAITPSDVKWETMWENF